MVLRNDEVTGRLENGTLLFRLGRLLVQIFILVAEDNVAQVLARASIEVVLETLTGEGS